MVRVGLLKVFGANDDNRRLLKTDDDTASMFPDEGAYEPPKGLGDYGNNGSMSEAIQEEPQNEDFPELSSHRDNASSHRSKAAAKDTLPSGVENSPITSTPESPTKLNLLAEEDDPAIESPSPRSPSKSKANKKAAKEAAIDPSKDALVTKASENGANEFLQFSFDNNFFTGDGTKSDDDNDKIPLASVSNRGSTRNGKEPATSPVRKTKRRHSSAKLSDAALAQALQDSDAKQQQEQGGTKGRRSKRRGSAGNILERSASSQEGSKEKLLFPEPNSTTLDRQSSNESTPKPTRRKRASSSAHIKRSSNAESIPFDGGDDTGDEGGEKTGSSSKRRSKRSSSKKDKNQMAPDSPESVSKKSTDIESGSSDACDSPPGRGLLKAPSLNEMLTDESDDGGKTKSPGRRGGRRTGRDSGMILGEEEPAQEGEESPRRRTRRSKSFDETDAEPPMKDEFDKPGSETSNRHVLPRRGSTGGPGVAFSSQIIRGQPETPRTKEKNSSRKKENRRRRRSLSDVNSLYMPKSLQKEEEKKAESEETDSPGYHSESGNAAAENSSPRTKTKKLLTGDNDSGRSERSLTLNDEANEVAIEAKLVTEMDQLHTSKAAIESAMCMLEDNLDEIKEVPFVSLMDVSKETGNKSEKEDEPDDEKSTGSNSPVAADIPEFDGSQLGNLELISQLRGELVESNMLLNESKLEVVRLREEVKDLNAQLEELRKK